MRIVRDGRQMTHSLSIGLLAMVLRFGGPLEHDGRMYDLASLVQQLSLGEFQTIGEAAPRSGQKMWDEVTLPPEMPSV